MKNILYRILLILGCYLMLIPLMHLSIDNTKGLQELK